MADVSRTISGVAGTHAFAVEPDLANSLRVGAHDALVNLRRSTLAAEVAQPQLLKRVLRQPLRLGRRWGARRRGASARGYTVRTCLDEPVLQPWKDGRGAIVLMDVAYEGAEKIGSARRADRLLSALPLSNTELRTSGWYCTPQMGYSLWTRPWTVGGIPFRGSDHAVTSSSEGTLPTTSELYTTASKPSRASVGNSGDAKRPFAGVMGRTRTTWPWVMRGMFTIWG